MPEAVSAQNITTVPLSEVNPPEPKQPSFFDRAVGKLVGFIAKATGQPDPITGLKNRESIPAQQGMNQEWLVQMPIEGQQVPQQEPWFFQKLVASTQNLLNKTNSVASSITSTTSNIAGKITEKTNAVAGAITSAPTMVANQATNLINKGVDMWGQLKDSIQTNAQNLAGNVQNFASNPVGGVQNFVANPIAGVQNIGNQVMQSGQQVMASAQQMWGQVVHGVQNAGGQVMSGVQNVWWGVVSNMQNMWGQMMNGVSQFAANPVGGVQNFVADPMAGVQNIGNQVMQSGQQVVASAQQMWGQVVNSVQGVGVQIPFQVPVQATESVPVQTQDAVPLQMPENASQTQVVAQSVPVQLNPIENVFSGIKQGASNFVEKTKQFVQNPVESIDGFAWSGAQTDQASVQTETENTTSLNQLENGNQIEKSESVPVQI